MVSYFTKQDNKIYRITSWKDLENLTGKDKSCWGNTSLYKAVMISFNNNHTIGKYAAIMEGWLTDDGEPSKQFKKGNSSWR